MLRQALIGILLLIEAAEASAAPLTVQVVDARGRPVRDAVVTLHFDGERGRRPGTVANYRVSQEDMQFHPFVLVVPPGAKVSFPNLDPTRHHVYSFSPAKKFELKLFARDQSRSVVFDKAGVVALGCNIHDAMTAFIFVSDTQFAAKTGANGIARFATAPDAPARISVWHPYLRARGNMVQRQIAAADRNATFSIAMRTPPMAMGNDY